MWSVLPFPTKNQPAIKFPTVPIISPSWKHLFESKCSSITPPPSGVHIKMISSLSLQLYPDHKHSKSIFFPFTHAQLQRKSAQSKQCPRGSSALDKAQRSGAFTQMLYRASRHKVHFIPYLPAPPWQPSPFFSCCPSSYTVYFFCKI